MTKFISWKTFAAICLLALSIIFYFIDFEIADSARHVTLTFVDNIAAAFIQILLVAIIIDSLLKNSERQSKLEKLNMVIGVFFNEVGTTLLSHISQLDVNLDTLRGELIVTGKWTDREFNAIGKKLLGYKSELNVSPVDLETLSGFILEERDFLLRLLENPVLLEHETFTELLLAVFHLADEFVNRENFISLPESDRKHLEIDIKRAYSLAAREWLVYMKYLKNSYPYLFSLAMRKNPFDVNAKVIIES
jgi:hypothetical protein